MTVPSRVLAPAKLARFMERHRLLDETSGTAPERFLMTLVKKALDFVPAEAAVLLLDDPIAKEDDRSRNELTVVATAGEFRETVIGASVRPVDGIAGFTYARGERTAVSEMKGARALSLETDERFASPVQSALGVPVIIESHVCGSLVLVNRSGGGFDERDERLMALFGDTLSLALQNLLDERRAREVARRDSLTALYNDRYFHKKLQQEIDKLAAGAPGDLTLLFLDCDHLKSVNDEHGHLAGSQILREVSFVLQRQLAATTSLPCRYGGDEFTVILLDCNQAQGMEIAEHIRAAIQEWTFLPMAIGPGEPALKLKGVITISIGVASYRRHCTPGRPASEQKNELLKKADTALYYAKDAGKNCVVSARRESGPPSFSSVLLKS